MQVRGQRCTSRPVLVCIVWTGGRPGRAGQGRAARSAVWRSITPTSRAHARMGLDARPHRAAAAARRATPSPQ